MSSNLAYALPARRPLSAPVSSSDPARIRLVSTRTRRRARPKIAYALTAIAVIFGIFLAQLMLTIALSGGAYKITDLQQQQRDLGRVSNSLGEKLDTVGSTQNLAANATALGMVASSSPAFLRLSDGQVLGRATVAQSGANHLTGSASAGNVPNSLLDGVALVNPGHGQSNASESGDGGTQSNQGDSDSSSGSSSGQSSSGSEAPTVPAGDLPSPQTH